MDDLYIFLFNDKYRKSPPPPLSIIIMSNSELLAEFKQTNSGITLFLNVNIAIGNF